MKQSERQFGFIGLGNMGGPMVNHLASTGATVFAHDADTDRLARVASAGIVACGSAAEVGARATTVFLSLPTPEIVSAVVLGDHGLAQGEHVKEIIDFSTIGPRAAARIASVVAGRRITYVDAPVSGGVTGAGSGKLSLMVSCPRATYDDLLPTLQVFGKPFFVGAEAGHAQVLKLVNNMLSACAIASTAEALVFGAKAGLDPAVMLEVLNSSSGSNSATRDKFPRAVLPRTFDFGFTTELALKDIGLCVNEAEAAGVPMPMGVAVKEMFLLTKLIRGAKSDFTELCRVVEEWGGAVVEAKPAC